MTWLSKWLLSSTLIFLFALILSLASDETLKFTLDELLTPWENLCRWILPHSWFTLGDITLRLAVMYSGLVICSAIVGGTFTLAYQLRK